MLYIGAKGQPNPGSVHIINTESFNTALPLPAKAYELACTNEPVADLNTFTSLRFSSPSQQLGSEGKVAGNVDIRHIYLKFILHNSTDTVEKLAIYPGYYFKAIHIIQTNDRDCPQHNRSNSQEERNRISADMHDELGGGMTAIRLMSELAIQRGTGSSLPEIAKISASANDLLGK